MKSHYTAFLLPEIISHHGHINYCIGTLLKFKNFLVSLAHANKSVEVVLGMKIELNIEFNIEFKIELETSHHNNTTQYVMLLKGCDFFFVSLFLSLFVH